MIISESGYSIIQNVSTNTITIGLPQTIDTFCNTTSPVVDRKRMLTESEEAVLLQFVIQLFSPCD